MTEALFEVLDMVSGPIEVFLETLWGLISAQVEMLREGARTSFESVLEGLRQRLIPWN